MKDTVRISRNEYDELREYRFKQLFAIPTTPIFNENRELKEKLKKSEMFIEELQKVCKCKTEIANEKEDEVEKLKEGIKWRQDAIVELEDEIDKKNEEIEDLKATVDRQNKLLTEKELYEKKMKVAELTGVPAMDAVLEKMCRVEAKIEAQENPYFF